MPVCARILIIAPSVRHSTMVRLDPGQRASSQRMRPLLFPPVREALIGWFRESGRELPWRETSDPYAILVSEVMLQQTQVERVVPRWRRWLERWPAVEALSNATPAEVIVEWQGLGYNRRAVNLHRAARVVARVRLAGRPDGTAGRRPLHRGGGREFRLRQGRAAGGYERPPHPGAHRGGVRRGLRPGALRPWRHDLPRANPSLWGLPARGACPSRGSRYEPLRRQSRFEGSFRQRRALALRAIVAGDGTADREALTSLERDGLVRVGIDGRAALPDC